MLLIWYLKWDLIACILSEHLQGLLQSVISIFTVENYLSSSSAPLTLPWGVLIYLCNASVIFVGVVMKNGQKVWVSAGRISGKGGTDSLFSRRGFYPEGIFLLPASQCNLCDNVRLICMTKSVSHIACKHAHVQPLSSHLKRSDFVSWAILRWCGNLGTNVSIHEFASMQIPNDFVHPDTGTCMKSWS